MIHQDMGLTDLVNLEDWQKTQDLFSDVLEVTLQTISPYGKALFKTSRPNRLCTDILNKSATRQSDYFANYLLGKESKNPIEIREKTKFSCMLGLEIFVAPIKATGDKVIAYMVVGPLILKSRKAISEYAKDAKELNINLEDLTDALIDINVLTYSKAYSITQLVESIFSHIAQSEYHKKRLGKIAPEVMKMDPSFSRYYEEKILSALLDSCTLALNADSGSVMTLDKETNMLHIKLSSKLENGAKENVNMKMGEGIAGLAAATARPIILPQDENKKELSGKLKRKHIKSSLIIPFNKGNSPDVGGVVNLNIVRKEKDFSERDIALIKELTHLASIALMPFQKKNP